MAILLAAGVPYTRWFGFAVRGVLLIAVVGIVGVLMTAAR
jgi:uncharacterized ion transporter superfamily protein YfcC